MIELNVAILHGPVFIRTALPRSRGLSLGDNEMPLHDAVGVNCTTEYQGADTMGCAFDGCVNVI